LSVSSQKTIYMAHNENLANRIREALAHLPNVEEKRMFGGLAFMVNNKMLVAAGADRMMCRFDPTLHEEITKTKACAPVMMRGREYKGFVHVSDEHIKDKREFDYWIELALAYNETAKASKARRKK
jgi:TfoX/Sxy family transcriptional regulator of competence genes